MQGKKSKIVVIFSIIILLFGVIGCILSFGGIYLVRNINLGVSDSQMITTVSSSLGSATKTLEDSSTALKNIAITVGAAKDSLDSASVMLLNSSEALAQIAETMNFEIIGIKPLEDTSQYFLSIADDLVILSGNIDNLSRSLGTNVDDINTLSTDMGDISTRLDNVSTSLSESTETGLGLGIKSLLYIILAIMGTLNIMFILIGSSLIILNK
jgi:hypothetical protein